MIHQGLSDILNLKRLPLGELGLFYGGLSGKSKEDFESGNSRFIPYMNVFSNISIDVDNLEVVQINDGERQNKVKYGDILFTGSSETPDECGMSSVMLSDIDEENPIYLNSFCFGYRFNDIEKIVPSFYKHLFRSYKMRERIGKTANGVTRFNISKKTFAKILIPVPSIEQQKEIADKLEAFTTLIEKLNEEIELRKKQISFYLESILFGEDDTNSLSDYAFMGKGRVSADKLSSDNYVSVENLLKNKAGRRDAETVPSEGNWVAYSAGDVLIGNIRPYLRKIWFADRDGGTNGDVVVVRSKDKNQLLPRFLYYVLSSEKFFNYYSSSVKDGKMPRGDKGKLLEFAFPYIEKDVQSSLVEKFDTMNTLISKLEEERDLRQKQYEYYREKLLTFE